MNKIVCLFLLLLCLGLISCKNKEKRRLEGFVKEWGGKEILFPIHSNFSLYGEDTVTHPVSFDNHKIISYVDSLGCIQCKLKLNEWKKFIIRMDSMGLQVPVLFFMYSHDIQSLKNILISEKFDYPVCIDQEDSFNKLNHFPTGMTFHTFLLDKNNKVVAIGNPIHNPKVRDLYMSIIQGKKLDINDTDGIKTRITVKDSHITLGTFDFKQEQKVEFVIKNIGNNPLVIDDVITSCGCITLDYSKEPIHPNGIAILHVIYKAEQPEHFDKTLTVYCNTKSPILLKITGDAR